MKNIRLVCCTLLLALSSSVFAGDDNNPMNAVPMGRRMYIQLGGNLQMVDTATHAVVGNPITLEKHPGCMAYNPDDHLMYVASRDGKYITFIDIEKIMK